MLAGKHRLMEFVRYTGTSAKQNGGEDFQNLLGLCEKRPRRGLWRGLIPDHQGAAPWAASLGEKRMLGGGKEVCEGELRGGREGADEKEARCRWAQAKRSRTMQETR